MPIQTDKAIFPHIVPPPPSEFTPKSTLDWMRDMATAYNELTKQLVDKYNGHIKGTHPHPNGWPVLRVPRPGFKYQASDQVVVEASALKPAYFKIGADLFEVTSNLTLDLDTSGVGGLRAGLTKAADTPYYVYAVNNSGSVALIADTVAPSTGLTGYNDWTYIGAFATRDAAATIIPFVSDRGKYVAGGYFDTSGAHTGTTATTQFVFATIPLTAKEILFTLRSEINAVGHDIVVGPTSGTSSADATTFSVRSRANSNNATFENTSVPLLTAQTVWMDLSDASHSATLQVYGWIENPTEYK